MSTESLSRVRMVLCRPGHPGNVGAAARALKTMGLRDLRLVAPQRFPAPEAQWMASHALDVLSAARVHATLVEAIGDCVAAFALSARPREWSPQPLGLREAAAVALERARAGPVALVFGNETAGLSNEELLACQFAVRIPTDPDYSSLNLAQAVQVAAYELRMAASAPAATPGARAEQPATVADVEGLYAHLEEAALASGFLDPADPKKLRERWRRLFSRVALEREEVNILRGLLRSLLPRRGNRRTNS
jgi:tRNA/rRNA methyltransferase